VAARHQRLRHRAGEPLDVVRAICSLFSTPEAKASAASSRWSAPRAASAPRPWRTTSPGRSRATSRWISVVVDLDLAFGTAGLDYNQDPPQGIADAVFSPDRVDTAFVDRLLSKCTDHLSLLAAPATLERVYDFGADAFDSIFDTLRTTMPCIVLDVPHLWSGWTKRALIGADDILIVATPDLANLRNTKNIFDTLKAARPNDHLPLYCLNQTGVPKRPEISAGEFAKAIESKPIATIPFEPQIFGAAANNGQMIAEISASHRTAELFLQIAQRLTGRGRPRGARSFMAPLIESSGPGSFAWSTVVFGKRTEQKPTPGPPRPRPSARRPPRPRLSAPPRRACRRRRRAGPRCAAAAVSSGAPTPITRSGDDLPARLIEAFDSRSSPS